MSAVGMCEIPNCDKQCGTPSGGGDDGGGTAIGSDGGGGSSGGGQTGACYTSASGLCLSGVAAAGCTGGSMFMTSCPTAGLVGCCTTSTGETCYYMGMTSDVMATCTMKNGTFSTQP
jgi:hypothetical protein